MLMAADTVFVAAALLSFLLSLPMTSEPHASYFCWLAPGSMWLHVWFSWNCQAGLKQHIRGNIYGINQHALIVHRTAGIKFQQIFGQFCIFSAPSSIWSRILEIIPLSRFHIHPLSSWAPDFLAGWSQVRVQTWLMLLRLTHAPRHQPGVWSQRWHKLSS